MKIELNTEICPIIIPDTYGTDFQNEIDESMWDDFTKLMIDKAYDAIKDVFDYDIGLQYKSLTMGEFHSPREYNFITDWIDFYIEVPDDYVDFIKTNVNDDFFEYAEKNFGTHDGFISFYPYDKLKFFNSEKYDYIISMWIMWKMSKERDIQEYQLEYLNTVWDYATENGYVSYEEEDESEEQDMFKDTIKEILSFGNYTLIEYQKAGRTEWNVALNYDREHKCWDSGNYCYSLESALITCLMKMNSNAIKSYYQQGVEYKTEMTYDRLTELATLFKDGLIEDDEESAIDYFNIYCEMDESEKEFFGIKEREE